jgi:hypothetical protein
LTEETSIRRAFWRQVRHHGRCPTDELQPAADEGGSIADRKSKADHAPGNVAENRNVGAARGSLAGGGSGGRIVWLWRPIIAGKPTWPVLWVWVGREQIADTRLRKAHDSKPVASSKALVIGLGKVVWRTPTFVIFEGIFFSIASSATENYSTSNLLEPRCLNSRLALRDAFDGKHRP